MALDEERSKNVFNHVMSLWVIPEVESRKQRGVLGNNFVLDSAQVLLDPDKNTLEVRLNKEVKAVATVKLKSGVHKEVKGEPVYEHEIQDIQRVTLTNEDNANSAHVTLLKFKEKWIMHFDFRYNKQKARERFDAGKEFYIVAKYCFDSKLLRPLVDSLFSAAELLVTAALFVTSEANYPSEAKHRNIQYRYNSFIKIGNPNTKYMEAFNKLSGLRDDARYLRKPFRLVEEKAKEFLETIDEMINYIEKFIA